jgi:mannose-1-phosphate guanylyltransferase/mannose-6-phosphate isomerase
VTNEEHRFLALDQLRELKNASRNIATTMLLEPFGKNTAQVLTLTALYA